MCHFAFDCFLDAVERGMSLFFAASATEAEISGDERRFLQHDWNAIGACSRQAD